MSTEIDQRVIEMRFDNKQFESNVSQTMSSLDELKQSLNFNDTSKSLEKVSDSARRVNLSPLSDSANAVKLKFSALYAMVDETFRGMVRSAEMHAKRIVSAFTIDPIKTGFQEYETQINAIQTILANTESKGTTLDDVNGALDELNTYADKTIYNFTEMTRNIGTFTAAGVDLDTSVSAIKGIANLAAVSGSTSQQASTAMYQLSQALSSGTVKLMDWNSVVNAGMGGQVFQDALKETARVHGIAIDDMIKEEGSFRETLSNGWLSSEILTETLSKFTGDLSEEQLKSMGYTKDQIDGILKMGKTANDAATKVKTFTQLFDTLKEAAQSGWTQTWEILVGDFEEAKELLTNISDTVGGMIGAMSDARNKLLENWKVLGGRTALIDALKNTFEGLMSILTPIADAFHEVFSPITSKQLFAFTEGLRDLTAKFKLSKSASDNLKRTFKGLFAVVDIIKQAIVAVLKLLRPILNIAIDLVGVFFKITAVLGDWIVILGKAIKSSDIFNKTIEAVVIIVNSVYGAIKKLFGALKSKVPSSGFINLGEIFEKIGNKILELANSFDSLTAKAISSAAAMFDSFKNSKFVGVLKNIWGVIKNITAGIGTFFSIIATGISNMFSNSDVGDAAEAVGTIADVIFGAINTLVAGGLGVAIFKFINNLSKVVDDIGGIGGTIKGIFDDVRGCLQEYQKSIKANVLKKIAVSIAILAASLLVLSLIDPEKLTVAIAAVSLLFAELMLTMKIFTSLDTLKGKVTKVCGTMLAIAATMLILSVALKIMGALNWEQMGVSLITLTTSLALLIGTVKLIPEKDLRKTASSLVTLSVSLVILAAALKIMSTMGWREMGVSLISLAGGLVALVGATHLLSKKMTPGVAFSMILLSTSLIALAAALKIMGTMDIRSMGIALLGLAGAMGAIILVSKTMGSSIKGGLTMLAVSGAMLIFAGALVVLCAALKILEGIDWETLKKGGVVLGALLGSILALAGISALMGSSALYILAFTGAALMLAGALIMLCAPLKMLETMDWSAIGKLAVVLTTMVAALALLATISLLGVEVILMVPVLALSLLTIAGSMVVLAVALERFNNVQWSSIGKGALVLFGTMGIFTLLAPLLLASSTTMLVASVALVALAGALIVLSVAFRTLETVSWGTMGKGLLVIVALLSTLGLAGALLAPLTPALIALGVALTFIGVACMAAGAGVWLFAQGVSALVASGKSGIDAMVESIKQIAMVIPEVAIILAKGIVEFCRVLGESAPTIGTAFVSICLTIIDSLKTLIPALMSLLGTALDELLNFLVTWGPKISETAYNLLTTALKTLRDNIDQITSIGVDIVVKFINGIASRISSVAQAGFDMIIKFIDSLTNAVNDDGNRTRLIKSVIDLGKAIITGFIKGVTTTRTLLKDALIDIGKLIIQSIKDFLGIHSPSTKFMEIGKNTILGFINGVKSKVSAAVSAMKQIPSKCLTAVKEKISSFKEAGKDMALGLAKGIKNKISSVVDGAKSLGSKALNGLKNLLGIKSPSREFEKIGMYSDEGLAIGLDKFAGVVKKSATGVGETALTSLGKSISNISNLVNDAVDSQPTIRPVLDLSDVESGANRISGMFSGTSSIGVQANLSSINSAMNRMGQNGKDNELASAINKLSSRLNNIGNTTYSINGVTYDDGSNITNAVRDIVRAAKIGRRV